jgi:quinol monooxygenase YgiN
LSFHLFVRFEPRLGKKMAFREELLRVVEPTRAEIGCSSIRIFESLREPSVFAIHSEWVDEAAFELHSQLPHTVRFLKAAEELLTHPVEGLRSREIVADTVVDALILDLLEWLAKRDRSYEDVMDAWRTSCPKLPVWEDANDRGLVTQEEADGRLMVRITSSGLALLQQRRPSNAGTGTV